MLTSLKKSLKEENNKLSKRITELLDQTLLAKKDESQEKSMEDSRIAQLRAELHERDTLIPKLNLKVIRSIIRR